jgi:hypothetical protein
VRNRGSGEKEKYEVVWSALSAISPEYAPVNVKWTLCTTWRLRKCCSFAFFLEANSLFFTDNDGTVEFLSSLNASGEAFWYFSVLFVLHIDCFYTNCAIPKKPDVADIANGIASFTHDLGFSLHCTFRALTGAVPTGLILLIL